MSCFIVNNKTITAICEGLNTYNIGISNPNGKLYDREDFRDPDDKSDGYFRWLSAMREEDIRSPRTREGFWKCGQALVDMNYRSVNARYNEDEKPREFMAEYLMNSYDSGPMKGMTFRKRYNPRQILEAIRCYDYQSCECEEYERSGIHAALRRLTFEIAYELAKSVYEDDDEMSHCG